MRPSSIFAPSCIEAMAAGRLDWATLFAFRRDAKKRTTPALISAATAALALPALAQSQLPNGNGKQIIETQCTVCHELLRITNAGHTRDEWDNVVHNMIMMGAVLKP